MISKKTTLALAASLTACMTASMFGQAAPALKTMKIATGFSYPTFVTHAPGDHCRLFVLEKKGVIKIIDMTQNPPAVLATPFLNIDPKVVGGASLSDEQGLLGMAFHPDYDNNGTFFVYYTRQSDSHDVVERYKVSADPNVADASTATYIWDVTDPFVNHNAGWMDFGPDGYLYIAMGDGGSANDPNGNAQNVASKLGKIHRIDPIVNATSAPFYNIPADNPFVGGSTTDDTIWALGVRNPWRDSFDRATGDLWIGDVGQGAWEEIDFQPAGTGGRNYGWRCMEGLACTGLTGCTCNGANLTLPIKVYPHGSGTSAGLAIIGGYVYRGCAIPGLQGFYFYADNSNNNIWGFRYTPATGITDFTLFNSQLLTSIDGTAVNTIASFGQDVNGEMYIVKHGGTTTGTIFKIIPAAGDTVCPAPTPGDLNGDGKVDGADLGMMLADWGTPAGDLNCDQKTDGADLGILLANWTFGP